MSPDASISQLLAIPPQIPPSHPSANRQYELGVQSQLKLIEGIPSNRLLGPVSGKDTLLDILNPSTGSIPYLYALLAHARASNEHGAIAPQSPVWDHTISFISSFDPIQIRYCGSHFRQLLELIHEGIGDDPAPAIVTAISAIRRIDPTCSTLTSTHVHIVETCLRKRAFKLALPLLDMDIYHLPGAVGTEFNYPSARCDPSATSANYMSVKSGFTVPLTYQDYLTYFLYGASIYIALKMWDRALNFLEIVLAAPLGSGHLSMIQVEAYKKWSLVSILVHGRPGRAPRNMTQFAARQCHNVARAYSVLGDTFKHKDTKALEAEIDAGPFKEDCNYSLALLVLAAHYRFAISNLSRVYARLPLHAIPALISRTDHHVKDTEALISELIASGQLNARLITPEASHDVGQTILEFLSPLSSEGSEDELLKEQIAQKQQMIVLQERMTEARQRIELSKQYIASAARGRKQEANKKDAQGPMDDEEMLVEDY